jgi:hypothetical protein
LEETHKIKPKRIEVKIDKKPWMMIVGITTMFFWAMVLCLASAIYAPLDIARGAHIGNNLVGSISRYWDPILLGVLVAFAVFSWQHQPPSFSWKKGGRFGEITPVAKEIITGFLASSIILFTVFVIHESQSYYQISRILLIYLVFLFTPYGWRGAIVTTTLFTLFFWSVYGLLFAGALFVVTWIGKWIIWWGFNIISFGCKDTVMKLNEKLRPDHSQEGTDIPPEQLNLQ